ncbi:MAG TPA: hypothetical protein VMT70_11030 [Vicinamibacteria bacterium]|nr:hypothetical protein [Vicinamibacteria bacterium]
MMQNLAFSLTHSCFFPRRSSRTSLLLGPFLIAGLALAACGGSGSPADPGKVTPAPTPVPTPTPTPSPAQSAACRLTAPTVDCATHPQKRQELAPALQAAIDAAVGTPGTMYTEYANKIYNLDQFRSITISQLTAAGLCAAWDYGNLIGDEIYLRSADGCVIEQYDLIDGGGGVRPAGAKSNIWSDSWGQPVPDPRPQFPKEGDLSCSLPGDYSTFCFSIKFTPGAFGPAIYALLAEVMNENPQIFDKTDFAPGGQRDFDPNELKVPAWRIVDQDAYIAAVEKKVRSQGFCGYVENGDILKVKSLAKGNVFHEEMDIVQNPPSGDAYVSFVIKDRCHNAGF